MILTELLSDVATCAPDDDEHGAEHDAAEHDCRVAHHQLGLHQLILMICFLPPDHKASSFFCLESDLRCCIRDESFCCFQRSATVRKYICDPAQPIIVQVEVMKDLQPC